MKENRYKQIGLFVAFIAVMFFSTVYGYDDPFDLGYKDSSNSSDSSYDAFDFGYKDDSGSSDSSYDTFDFGYKDDSSSSDSSYDAFDFGYKDKSKSPSSGYGTTPEKKSRLQELKEKYKNVGGAKDTSKSPSSSYTTDLGYKDSPKSSISGYDATPSKKSRLQELKEKYKNVSGTKDTSRSSPSFSYTTDLGYKDSPKSSISGYGATPSKKSRLQELKEKYKKVSKTKSKAPDASRRATPYNSREWRKHFENKHGKDKVFSTTVPSSNKPNVRLAGKRHKKSGIVFDLMGYPIFDDVAKYDVRFSAKDFKVENYYGQMRMATRALWRQMASDSKLKSQFNEAQRKTIEDGEQKIPGYTWHHHQDTGRMQLVPYEIHKQTGHIGGDAMSKGR